MGGCYEEKELLFHMHCLIILPIPADADVVLNYEPTFKSDNIQWMYGCCGILYSVSANNHR